MSTPSPLATPLPWDLVADGYVDENVPIFERFADDALRLAGLRDGDRVLDVATGPGTLALRAAPRASEVVAVDFSPQMLDRLRERAASVPNVDVRQGDGQALALPDDSFDVAASMFGLMFFPDRAAGFRELRRVVKPGGRVAVSSWQPFDQVPALAALFGAIGEHVPQARAAIPSALSDADTFRGELEGAGFRDVAVHAARHGRSFGSVDAFWESNVRVAPPLVLLRRAAGEAAFTALAAAVRATLHARLGPGPVEVAFPAWIGVGTA